MFPPNFVPGATAADSPEVGAADPSISNFNRLLQMSTRAHSLVLLLVAASVPAGVLAKVIDHALSAADSASERRLFGEAVRGLKAQLGAGVAP